MNERERQLTEALAFWLPSDPIGHLGQRDDARYKDKELCPCATHARWRAHRALLASGAAEGMEALIERLLPSSGFELTLLHGDNRWRASLWSVGPVRYAADETLAGALQALAMPAAPEMAAQSTSSPASAYAMHLVQRNLDAGLEIEVPSLGIKVKNADASEGGGNDTT